MHSKYLGEVNSGWQDITQYLDNRQSKYTINLKKYFILYYGLNSLIYDLYYILFINKDINKLIYFSLNLIFFYRQKIT
jgi:hypothetical protein